MISDKRQPKKNFLRNFSPYYDNVIAKSLLSQFCNVAPRWAPIFVTISFYAISFSPNSGATIRSDRLQKEISYKRVFHAVGNSDDGRSARAAAEHRPSERKFWAPDAVFHASIRDTLIFLESWPMALPRAD